MSKGKLWKTIRSIAQDHQKKCDLCCYSNIHCNFLDLNNTKLVYINCPVSDFKTLWKNKQNCAETFLCFFFFLSFLNRLKSYIWNYLKQFTSFTLIYFHSTSVVLARCCIVIECIYICTLNTSQRWEEKKECDQVFSLFSHCWISVFVPLLKATASYRTQAAGHKNELIQQ